jgi:rubrerythrin
MCLLDWDYEANEHQPEYYTSGSGEKVHWKCHICGHKWETAICNRTRDYKNGCPLCSGKTIVNGVNDLFTRRPDLMKEWDWERNAGIDPKKIGIGSHLYAYWKCEKCDHIWKSKIYNRANGKGCPTCASRKTADLHRIRAISKNGSLKDTHPLLANEWHPTKNGEYRADMFSKGSDFKAWWICSKCQHEWYATIGSRSRGSGCPKCANKKK